MPSQTKLLIGNFDARPHPNPIQTLTRPAATLSHLMGEGQERAFHVPRVFGYTRDGIGRPAPGKL